MGSGGEARRSWRSPPDRLTQPTPVAPRMPSLAALAVPRMGHTGVTREQGRHRMPREEPCS